jgi:Ala-tRNA(Pro) deacylase
VPAARIAAICTAHRTAEACHVSGDRLAKAIVLRRDGGYMLAVLPASHCLRMSELRAKLGDDIDMASEHEINRLFADCARGAVPAVGACYGLDVVVDDSIQTQPEIYMEAGDHETLLHLTFGEFARLNVDALNERARRNTRSRGNSAGDPVRRPHLVKDPHR